MYKFIKNNKSAFIGLYIAAYFAPFVGKLFVSSAHIEIVRDNLLSVLLFPFGVFFMDYVLMLQVNNPHCSKRILNIFCTTFLLFFSVPILTLSFLAPLMFYLSPEEVEKFIVNPAPLAMGITYSIFKIRNKFVIGESQI